MAVMGVKTVVAAEKTCLLPERSARRVEDGGRGEGGRGVLWSRRTDRECHTLSLIWQLPISPPINRLLGTLLPADKEYTFLSPLSREDVG